MNLKAAETTPSIDTPACGSAGGISRPEQKTALISSQSVIGEIKLATAMQGPLDASGVKSEETLVPRQSAAGEINVTTEPQRDHWQQMPASGVKSQETRS